MLKEEYEQVLGRKIRLDTYYMAEEMRKGLNYDDAKSIVLRKHGGEFKLATYFVKEKTILDIIDKIHGGKGYYPSKKKEKKVRQISNQVIFEDGEKGYGIYGIYNQNNKLIYIGMTTRNFMDRWNEHLYNIKENISELYLYRYLQQYKDEVVTFRVLIDASTVNVQTKLRSKDLQSMELALISLWQPICNIEGRLKPYKYRT